jgi:Cu+-exporting ATPase
MSKAVELTLKIDGMHCAGCVRSIEQGVSHLPGVTDCKVNLALNSATVTYDTARTGESGIIDKIKELGYGATIGTPDILTSNQREELATQRRFLFSLLFAIPLIVVAMWPMLAGKFLVSSLADGLLQAVLAGAILFYAGRTILADAFKQARYLRANMNTLIAMGTLTAYGWSLYALLTEILTNTTEPLYFDSAGMIITLILLGRFLEAKSKGKAGEAIKTLLKLRPSQTVAIINDVEEEIDVDSVQPGMVLLVKPGERIPADGEIIESSPVIDESMLTGESMPVEKSVGNKVVGGSLNGNIPFKFRVTAAGEGSFLNTVVRLVAKAQGKKAPVQQLADKVAGVFAPIVIGIALMTLVLWLLLDPSNPILVKSVISVLIIACPCALGLATPTAVLAGTGRAAREGVIIRGGDVLEGLTKIDTIIFDKTGTLTHGELEVVEVKTLGDISQRELIRMVGSAENQAEHPVAQAIVRYMKLQQIEPLSLKNVVAKPGFGLEAQYDNRQLLVGNRQLMESEQIALDSAIQLAEEEMDKGRTVVFAALDKHVIGLISVADKVRSEAKDVIAQLKPRIHRLAMISGDNRRTAESVARSVGIDSFEAEIKPTQKKDIVATYRQSGFNVAMIGDGINDAPALAEANVGIAIGSGTDIAVETADVVLVRPELATLLKMFNVARATMRIIKQNLFWAFFYNVAAIPLAAGLFYPLFGWTLSPTIAAAAMAFSSLFVVTNSLRLNRMEFNK